MAKIRFSYAFAKVTSALALTFLSFLCSFNYTTAAENAEPRNEAPTAGTGIGATNGATLEATRRYPTSDEAFYVMSCMEINGQDAGGLQKCSCAINALEEQLPFRQYKDAELVLALRQAGGRNAGIFRDTSSMRDIVKVFIEAQKTANRRCFGERAASKGGDAVTR